MGTEIICRNCGHVGEPQKHTPGHFGLELALWLLVFPIGIIYTIWRKFNSGKVCSYCGSKSIISTLSPIGRKLLADTALSVGEAKAFAPEPAASVPLPAPSAKSTHLWQYLGAGVFLLLGVSTLTDKEGLLPALPIIIAGALLLPAVQQQLRGIFPQLNRKHIFWAILFLLLFASPMLGAIPQLVKQQ
jgi:hypothetical protein